MSDTFIVSEFLPPFRVLFFNSIFERQNLLNKLSLFMNILNVSSNFDVENYVSISSHSGARYPFMQLKVPSKILHKS